MSEGMQGGVQCTPEETIGFNAWHWLKTQEVNTFLYCILIPYPYITINNN